MSDDRKQKENPVLTFEVTSIPLQIDITVPLTRRTGHTLSVSHPVRAGARGTISAVLAESCQCSDPSFLCS
jgi:hypothetical protein